MSYPHPLYEEFDAEYEDFDYDYMLHQQEIDDLLADLDEIEEEFDADSAEMNCRCDAFNMLDNGLRISAVVEELEDIYGGRIPRQNIITIVEAVWDEKF